MNVAQNKDEDLDAVLTVSSSTNHSNEWIRDSRCSYHISPYRNWFSSLEQFDGGVVLMGNDNVCKKKKRIGNI